MITKIPGYKYDGYYRVTLQVSKYGHLEYSSSSSSSSREEEEEEEEEKTKEPASQLSRAEPRPAQPSQVSQPGQSVSRPGQPLEESYPPPHFW